MLLKFIYPRQGIFVTYLFINPVELEEVRFQKLLKVLKWHSRSAFNIVVNGQKLGFKPSPTTVLPQGNHLTSCKIGLVNTYLQDHREDKITSFVEKYLVNYKAAHMLVLFVCRVKITSCGSLQAEGWKWETDIWSQRLSPSRSRAVDVVRHLSQEQMVFTVGNLSVPKDT